MDIKITKYFRSYSCTYALVSGAHSKLEAKGNPRIVYTGLERSRIVFVFVQKNYSECPIYKCR